MNLINRYNDWLLPLLREFLFLPDIVNKFMDLRANVTTSCFKQFCCNYSVPGDLSLLSFSVAISTSKY
jgi:hypothetical protein